MALSTSYKTCLGSFRDKGLNFGKSKSGSESLEEQARDLLSAMEADQTIDMNRDWKVVFFRHNVRM